ncbi:MAG: cyclic nucleotide-binding domain-containing protein [Bacteriovoracaceae bacterium]|jgi:CRP/FNR family transcriptional regulator, cyclic AMP receptor protein|nr:cyclic nucleotide-binding domain-containing protein [Bacteriovoracaceae bacterium]
MSIVEVVKGCPLFYELYDDEILDIIKRCVVAQYNEGDFIIKQGAIGTDIFVILSGEVDVTVDTNDGQKKITSLKSGDLFGELVLINETKRTANIVCCESSKILVISYKDFYSYYQKKPKIFSILVLNVTRLLTKRLKNANLIIQELKSV